MRFLLFFGFLFLPASLHAASAISPWVQEVIQKADAGVELARTRPPRALCNDENKRPELEANLSFIREKTSSVVGFEAEAWQLQEHTVCYESDRRKLLLTLKGLLEKIQVSTQSCRFESAAVLKSTYDFVFTAYVSFLKGAENPSFQDPLLRMTYPFENEDAWKTLSGPVTDTASTAPLCAFTTDYAPHVIGYLPVSGEDPLQAEKKSYGCDADVLATLIHPLECDADVFATLSHPLDRDAQIFCNFLVNTDTFARSVYDTVEKALTSISAFRAHYNGSIPETIIPSKPAPPHETLSGCLAPLLTDPSSMDPQEREEFLAAYPEYFDLSRSYTDENGTVHFGPKDDAVLPIGLLFRPVTDYFGLYPSTQTLLRLFMDRRGDAGFHRPFPSYLTNVTLESYLQVMQATDTQNDLRMVSVNIEQYMAYIKSENRDGYRRSQDAIAPLDAAVQKFVHITKEVLPKQYIPDLAFFLARSCVDGHCQSTLDAVMKRTFNPYCTPYASGLYTDEETAQKCFCDESVKDSWDKWDEYCSEDFAADQEKYDALPEQFFPGCLP